MRPIRSLLIYIALVFGGGALLAPWLYLFTQWVAGQWSALSPLAANPFYRFVLRSILGLAFLGLWPLLRACRMLQGRELGLVIRGRPMRQFATGFALGFGSLAVVALLAILCGGRALNFSHSNPELLRHLRDASLAAILVAILEELIFRAALFGILRKSAPLPSAILLSSAVYASVHFLQKAPGPDRIDWLSGLSTLCAMFHAAPDGVAFIPDFFTLLVAGTILALAYQRTQTLFNSIGLHAGWIFWLKSYRFLTLPTPAPTQSLWGSDKLIYGWVPLLTLALLLVLMLCLGRPGSTPDAVSR